MNPQPQTCHCYASRVANAGAHLDRGEWACGHAIASRLLQCARAGGCSECLECNQAARRMMGKIRSLLAN